MRCSCQLSVCFMLVNVHVYGYFGNGNLRDFVHWAGGFVSFRTGIPESRWPWAWAPESDIVFVIELSSLLPVFSHLFIHVCLLELNLDESAQLRSGQVGSRTVCIVVRWVRVYYWNIEIINRVTIWSVLKYLCDLCDLWVICVAGYYVRYLLSANWCDVCNFVNCLLWAPVRHDGQLGHFTSYQLGESQNMRST